LGKAYTYLRNELFRASVHDAQATKESETMGCGSTKAIGASNMARPRGYVTAEDLRPWLPMCLPEPVRELTLCYALDGEVPWATPGDELEVYFDCVVHGMALAFMEPFSDHVANHIRDPLHMPFFTPDDFARFKSNGNNLTLLCCYWWPVTIVKVLDDQNVRIHYLGYSDGYDQDMLLSLLRPRQSPTRLSRFQNPDEWKGMRVGVRLHQCSSKSYGDSYAWVQGVVEEVFEGPPVRAKVKLVVSTPVQVSQLGFSATLLFDTCIVDVSCLAALDSDSTFARKQWFC